MSWPETRCLPRILAATQGARKLGKRWAAVAVDDIRGFQFAFVNGAQQSVSALNPLTVTIGSDVYTTVGATADTTNVSTTWGGISGVLTLSGNASVSDGTAGNTVTFSDSIVDYASLGTWKCLATCRE